MEMQREVTLMRASLGEFGEVAKALKPADMRAIIDAYLEFVNQAVESTGGVILELNGHDVCAVWNAVPEDTQEDHALRACRAAVKIDHGAQVVNAALGDGFPAVQVHAGVVTGRALVGALGTEERLRWTCIGPPAVEVERLHGLSCNWQVRVLLSHTAHAQVGEDVLTRTVDVIASDSGGIVPVYELWRAGEGMEEADQNEVHLATLYDEGFEAYVTHDMRRARECFQEYLQACPHDIPAQLHLERARNTEDDEEIAAYTY